MQPLVAIFIVVMLAILAFRLKFRRLATVLMAFALLAYLVCTFSPAGLLMMATLENRFAKGAALENVAGIVVLGGSFDTRVGRTRDEIELNDAADRTTAALALARRYPRAKVLFSGGVAAVLEDDIPETRMAETFFREQGLDPDRLMLDARARDTYENAVYARELARPREGETWLLVTSAYHMPRAVGCFRKARFAVVPYPVDYRTPAGAAVYRPSTSSTANLDKVHFAVREYLGLLAYYLSGRTDALFPSPSVS